MQQPEPEDFSSEVKAMPTYPSEDISDPVAFNNLNLKLVAGKLTLQTTDPVVGTTQRMPDTEFLPEFVHFYLLNLTELYFFYAYLKQQL